MNAQWEMIEYRGSEPLVWNGRPIAGVDMKSFNEHDWAVDTSVEAGARVRSFQPETASLAPPDRVVQGV